MADRTTKRPAIAAAISMLSLSLGVSGADAQKYPATPPPAPTGNPQGVLIGLDQPGSDQIKSEQWKSDQLKSQQFKSDQLKSQQFKSDQLKSQQWKSDQLKSQQFKSNQLKSNAFKM
jgi:hypothetical protein